MDNGNALIALGDALSGEVTTVAVEVTPAAGEHLRAWQVDQHVQALHEAGHAVIAAVLHVPVKAIDIKGRAGGFTEFGWRDDTMPSYTTASQARDMIVVSLAGWAIESVVIGQPTTGSDSDLRSATRSALDMIASGMDPGAPFVSFNSFGDHTLRLPTAIADEVGRSVMATLAEARARALDLAEHYRDQTLALARVVAERRRLTDDELLAALRAVGLDPVPQGE